MANVIELVTATLPVLDEQYAAMSYTAFLDTSDEMVQWTKNAKRFRVAKMRVDGLADYSRNRGFVRGSVDLVWEEREFTQDRGRAIQVDVMDNDETFGLAFGRLAGEFQRMSVIPEIDAYRFATYYQAAGHKEAYEIADGAGLLSYLDQVKAQMDDDEVPDDGGRVAFMNPTAYNALINDPALNRYLSWDSDGNLQKRVASYNGIRIISVPTKRFYTAIDTVSAGDDNSYGGYAPAEGATPIGVLVLHPSAVIQIAKRMISRIWAPTKELAAGTDGVNPDADAWKFDYRVYHDAFVLDNKAQSIYAATLSGTGFAAVTQVELSSGTAGVELSGTNTEGYTASVGADTTVQLIAKVTGGGVSQAVTWDSSNLNVAMVQNGYVHFFQAGSVEISCKSVYKPDVGTKVTFTVTGAPELAIGDPVDVAANKDKTNGSYVDPVLE